MDTSVLVALIVREPGWRITADWLSRCADALHWSTFGWGELTDTVARRVRRQLLSTADGTITLEAARSSFSRWLSVSVVDDDIRAAADLITADLDRALKFPDAVHIAIAQRLGATLVTHDRAQAAAARTLGVAAVNPLEEPA
jgi:predicted nucleic acid-binding protein